MNVIFAYNAFPINPFAKQLTLKPVFFGKYAIIMSCTRFRVNVHSIVA